MRWKESVLVHFTLVHKFLVEPSFIGKPSDEILIIGMMAVLNCENV